MRALQGIGFVNGVRWLCCEAAFATITVSAVLELTERCRDKAYYNTWKPARGKNAPGVPPQEHDGARQGHERRADIAHGSKLTKRG